MIKTKPWLDSVIRVPNVKTERHNNWVRLDKSERISRFPEVFFKKFIKSITQEDILAYPETMPLIVKLCKYHNVRENNIFLVPGADAAIKAFFEIAVLSGDEVIITDPCFPMYKVYADLFNAKAIQVPYAEQTRLDFDFLLDSIRSSTALIALANPNSPIGDYIEPSRIEQLVKKSSNFNIPVLIDEAYYEYSPGTAIGLVAKYENVGIARTFSKAFGGAGMRVAYVIASVNLIERLSKWRLMYEINQIGIKFAVYLLEHIDKVMRYAQETKKERALIVRLLTNASYDVIGSHANWFHLHGKKNNSKLVDILKMHKVLFKLDSRIPCDDRKDWIRLTVGPGLAQAPYIRDIINKNF